MSEKLQLRVTDEFRVRLREAAKKVGWTESAFARYLLETAMGDDARMSVLNQTVWQLNSKIQRKVSQLGQVMRDELERILLSDAEDE